MATQKSLTALEVRYDENKELDLQDFVQNATWREFLVELVQTNKLDPWDIDIIKVVDGYISVIKRMKVLDLHVPANIILAASILLRMKSDSLRVFEPEVQPDEAVEGIAAERIMPDVPTLVPRARLQPSKKITLMELMAALDEAMKMKEQRELLVKEANTPVPFYIDKEDIDEKTESIFKMLKRHVDRAGLTTFAYIANMFNHSESILLDLFIPLLFLAHQQRIIIMQEKFFDEIFIKIGNGKKHESAG